MVRSDTAVGTPDYISPEVRLFAKTSIFLTLSVLTVPNPKLINFPNLQTG